MQQMNGGGHDVLEKLKHHDQRLDSLESAIRDGFSTLTEEIKGMRSDLIEAATGENRIPKEMAMAVINQQAQAFKHVVYVLCAVIIALVTWFTGVKPEVLDLKSTTHATN